MSGFYTPGVSSETYTPDKLLAGCDVITRQETIAAGANLARGTLLGRITLGAATGTKASGTGDGTIGDVTLGAKAQVGTYVLTCTATAGNGGTFSVFAPDGTRLKDLSVGVAYTSPHINLTVADGAADWGAGAVINVVVAAGSGKLIKSLAAAVDGSQTPVAILADYAAAASTDVLAGTYHSGQFDESAVIFGTGHTAASTRAGLRALGIHLKSAQL